MIRVLLADDQALVRAGFRVLLETVGEFEVVGEAANGEQAVALTAARRPDVVLMDIRMPVLDGLQATRQIVSDPKLAQVRVLILTTFESDEYVFEALRSGASGFVVKDIPPADLLQAIRVVAAGEALLSPQRDAPADQRVRFARAAPAAVAAIGCSDGAGVRRAGAYRDGPEQSGDRR